MSFWRYKLLEGLVALATFPIVIVAAMTCFRLGSSFIDFDKASTATLLFAIPFLIAWLLFNVWVTKRAERWWISRRQNADGAPEVTRR